MLGAWPRSMSLKSHSLRRTSDAHVTTFALPAQRGSARRCLAGVVPIGKNDHIADVSRQIEGSQPGG